MPSRRRPTPFTIYLHKTSTLILSGRRQRRRRAQVPGDTMKIPHSPPPRPLYKQNSWSPDTRREETWQRRKSISDTRRHVRSKSVSDDDLEELKACIELGFGFDSPDVDPKLSDTLPALEFYHAVNKQCSKSLLTDGGDAEEVKMRLRQWAQLVACSVRQSSSSSI